MAKFLQADWLFVPAADVNVAVLAAVTVMVPVALTVPQPPDNGME